jgi:hypothetical protein
MPLVQPNWRVSAHPHYVVRGPPKSGSLRESVECIVLSVFRRQHTENLSTDTNQHIHFETPRAGVLKRFLANVWGVMKLTIQ